MDSNSSLSGRLPRSSIFWIILLIILIWPLAPLWTRAIENLAYRTFGLSSQSTMDSFVVAFVMTFVLVGLLFIFELATRTSVRVTSGQASGILETAE